MREKTLSAKLRRHDKSAGDVLEGVIDLRLTPDKTRYICSTCSNIVLNLSKGSKQVEEAKTSLKASAKDIPGTDVGKKLRAPPTPSTPLPFKKRKIVTSTPLKSGHSHTHKVRYVYGTQYHVLYETLHD